MERIISNNKLFTLYEYSEENEFEQDVIEHTNEIFGLNSVYIDIKKRIGEDNILTIPDGYLIDFSFKQEPHLYIIENELVTHDPYRHIGQQLLKFAISYKASGRKIKTFLLENILRDDVKKRVVEEGLNTAGYRNIDAFLEDIIFEKPVAAIVIIDEITSDLENVLTQLTMKTDIIELKKFSSENDIIYKFTPFQPEIIDFTEGRGQKVNIEDLDTIVVPANEDGFNDVFLGQDCWFAIRISSSMIDRIKYIAGYQTSPISAITYYAEVSNIEKYKDSGKYIVNFKDKAKKIGPITFSPNRKKVRAPQAPRYTKINKLLNAKSLDEVF